MRAATRGRLKRGLRRGESTASYLLFLSVLLLALTLVGCSGKNKGSSVIVSNASPNTNAAISLNTSVSAPPKNSSRVLNDLNNTKGSEEHITISLLRLLNHPAPFSDALFELVITHDNKKPEGVVLMKRLKINDKPESISREDLLLGACNSTACVRRVVLGVTTTFAGDYSLSVSLEHNSLIERKSIAFKVADETNDLSDRIIRDAVNGGLTGFLRGRRINEEEPLSSVIGVYSHCYVEISRLGNATIAGDIFREYNLTYEDSGVYKSSKNRILEEMWLSKRGDLIRIECSDNAKDEFSRLETAYLKENRPKKKACMERVLLWENKTTTFKADGEEFTADAEGITSKRIELLTVNGIGEENVSEGAVLMRNSTTLRVESIVLNEAKEGTGNSVVLCIN